MSDASVVNTLWALAQVGLAPACGGLRVLSLLTFGGLMTGVAIPWRFRGCLAGLLGWIAAAPGSLEVDSIDSLALVAGSEFAMGAAMGVSVGALLLGLKLAGELLDDRLRLLEATGEPMAGDGEAVGPCVRLLGGLGLAIVVFGGAGEGMPVLDGMLASFRGIPVGAAIEALSDWHGPVHVLNIALELCLRTALPVLAVISIVDWCQMLVSRAVPTAPSVLAASAVKPLLGLAMLVAVFGGACDAAMAAIRICLEAGGAA